MELGMCRGDREGKNNFSLSEDKTLYSEEKPEVISLPSLRCHCALILALEGQGTRSR